MIEIVGNQDIYFRIRESIPKAKAFVWLATANIKDLYIEHKGKWIPFLEILSELATRNVELRLLHAKEAGPVFQKEFDRFPNLSHCLERTLCQRVHFKTIIVDGIWAYSGSANLTGAGLGSRSADKRNFETGFIFENEAQSIDLLMEQFDAVWRGDHCLRCYFKKTCPEYKELAGLES